MIEDYYKLFENIDGIQALYIIDLDTRKFKSKIIDENHNKNRILDSVKHLFAYLKEGDPEQIFIEEKTNIFIRSLPTQKNKIFLLVTDKDIKLGTIFNLLKQLNLIAI